MKRTLSIVCERDEKVEKKVKFDFVCKECSSEDTELKVMPHTDDYGQSGVYVYLKCNICESTHSIA